MHKFVENLLNVEKVEFKALGEVAEIYGGLTGKSKTDFEKGSAKYIPYKNVFNNLEVDVNHLENVKVLENEKQHSVKYGDILFTVSSEILEEVGISSAVTNHTDEKIYLNSFCFGVRLKDEIKLIPKFSKYLFRTYFIRNQIIKTANGTTRFNISKERFKKIKIPIPPLSAQKQIVEILDKFTNLITELTAELTARKKQYDYYLKHLLSENEFIKQKIEWEKLGDICESLAKGTLKKEELVETGRYFVVNSGRDFYGKYDKYNNSGNTFTLAARGEYAGFVSYINEPFWAGGLCYPYRSKDENMVITNFIYFYLKSIEDYIMNKLVSRGSIPAINKADIDKLKIPIPTTEMQKKITTTLNTFNTIILKLSYEIELRKKQYEYYCNLLLNFK